MYTFKNSGNTQIKNGKSLGENKQKFFLGGMPYLLAGGGETNGRDDISLFREVLLDTANASLIHDLYFTEYAPQARELL